MWRADREAASIKSGQTLRELGEDTSRCGRRYSRRSMDLGSLTARKGDICGKS